MTKQKGLPPYFREYLDERFAHVLEKIEGNKSTVSKQYSTITKELKRLNGDVADIKMYKMNAEALQRAYIPRFEKMETVYERVKSLWWKALLAILIAMLIWIKESRTAVVNLLLTFIEFF